MNLNSTLKAELNDSQLTKDKPIDDKPEHESALFNKDESLPRLKLKKNGEPDRRYSSNKSQVSNINNNINPKKRKAEEISPIPIDPSATDNNNSEPTKALKNLKSNASIPSTKQKPCLIDLKSLQSKRDQLLAKLNTLETKISINQESANKIEKEAQNILRETEELESILTLQESFNPPKDLQEVSPDSKPNHGPTSAANNQTQTHFKENQQNNLNSSSSHTQTLDPIIPKPITHNPHKVSEPITPPWIQRRQTTLQIWIIYHLTIQS